MKLNINSIGAQLYRWFYSTSRMPESLCPYFWKLLLMWVFILPYSIICIPTIILEKLDPSENFSTGVRISISFLTWITLYCVLSMLFTISIFWYIYPKDTLGNHTQVIGSLLWIIAFGVGCWYGCKWLIEKYKESKIQRDEFGRRIWNEPKQDSIIITFIKASYNKYCPRINWEYKK